MRIALDTNAYSDWRTKGRWGDLIETASEILISAIVLGELRYGFQLGSRRDENERKLTEFLASEVVTVVEIGDLMSHHYGRLKTYLRKQGTPIPENDIWIGACAVKEDVVLLTADAHFEKLPEVRVMWSEG
jgi:tRNA(fMet)-specific endonuclease VapC